ncbi:bifunctional 3'-5' exonuclease/ATP-dependent helicase WRN-like [Mytilus trossulus]|uniref:bifunctional 3'-5' exonuclease/ATP-dependent helicase WRN-like n=1 Tax=Mytilus trossulus TaxID=6551 RepID=UPI003005F707
MADDILDSMITEVCALFGVEMLKFEQREIVSSLLARRDCMAELPTGFGKSLPYQIYLPLIRRLKAEPEPTEVFTPETVNYLEKLDVEEKIIVCCPLVSLMNDQVKRLETVPGLKSAFKGNSEEGDQQIRNGSIDVIFASPETLVGDPYWRSQLQQLPVGLIVLDEFHTITTWGGDEETDEQEAFRKWFRYIGEMRAMFPNATALALSATCTNKIKKQVMKILNFKTDTTMFLNVSPNKSNIKLVVKKIENSVDTAMFWLIDSLERLGKDFPKTLIYANSINEVSKLYTYTTTEVPRCKSLVEMFHSETSDKNKKKIIEAMCQISSDIRIVFATTALGMGIDVVACHSIILYGSPRSILDLVQEIGRVGRDNSNSVAILMHNSYHLRSVNKEVKTVFTTNTCRRQVLMSNFLQDTELEELAKKECNKHTCCDNCAKNCSCGDCEILQIESLIENVETVPHDSDSDTIEYEYNAAADDGVELFSSDDDFLAELDENV